MAESLFTSSIICYVIAGVFLAIAVALFVVFKIPKVFNDFTGRSAKKTIKKFRAANEKTGNKSYRSSDVNKKRGKVTETVHPEDAKIDKKTKRSKKEKLDGTGLIKENRADEYSGETTGLLNETNEVETSPLYKDMSAPSKITLRMIGEAMYVHTDEVID